MIGKKERTLKKVIAALAVLLVLALGALAGVLMSGRYGDSISDSAPDNHIFSAAYGSETATKVTTRGVAMRTASWTSTADTSRSSYEDTVLEIYRGNADVNQPFAVSNMFPGDAIPKDYQVKVTHRGSVVVHFRAAVRPGYEKLAEVLKVKVQIGGQDRYDGLMRDMPESLDCTTPNTAKAETTELDYRLTVYLDTSVGNEYQAKELVADFEWWVETEETEEDTSEEESDHDRDHGWNNDSDDDSDESNGGSSGHKGQDPDKGPGSTPGGDDVTIVPGELAVPPKTGDITFWLAGIVLASGLFFLLLLMLGRRRKEEQHEA